MKQFMITHSPLLLCCCSLFSCVPLYLTFNLSELGYKTEEDHIRDCKDVEDKKRKQIFLLEKEAVMREEKNVGLEVDNDAEEEPQFDNSGDAADYD